MEKRVIIAADPAGFALKNAVAAHLTAQGYTVEDVGTQTQAEPVAYYEAGRRVGQAVDSGAFARGLLFCGSGMGVSLVANKFQKVFCGVVESVYTAQLCRRINNCNVLALGGFLIGPEKACAMADAFLQTDFAPEDFWIDSRELQTAYQACLQTCEAITANRA